MTNYTVRTQATPDGWIAIDVPELPGVHAQCRPGEDWQAEAELAIAEYLEAAKEVGEEV